MFSINSLSMQAVSTARSVATLQSCSRRQGYQHSSHTSPQHSPPLLSRNSSEQIAGDTRDASSASHRFTRAADGEAARQPPSASVLHASERVGASAARRGSRPSTSPPVPPATVAAESDRRRGRGVLRATLRALDIMGPVMETGGAVGGLVPFQRYHDSAITHRRVYDSPRSPPLAPPDQRSSESRRREERDRLLQQRQPQRPFGDADADGEDGEGAAAAAEASARRSRRGRAGGNRVRAGGLSADVQHTVLRRLQYQRPVAIDDLAMGTPYTPYTPGQLASARHFPDEGRTPTTSLHATGSPLGPLPRLTTPEGAMDTASTASCCAAHTQEEQEWVRTLQPALSGEVPFPEASTHCQVCLRRFRNGEDVAELPCGHLFHFYCVVRWLRTRAQCPLCRQEVLGKHGDGRDDAKAVRTHSAPSPDL